MSGVLENNTTTGDTISLNGLGIKKGKYGDASMMLKTGMEVDQYYNVFTYRPQIPQKYVNPQYRTIGTGTGTGVKPEPKFVLPVNKKEKVGKDPPHINLSWITRKHCCPPQWIRLGITQVEPLWRGSSKIEHQKYLVTQNILWM